MWKLLLMASLLPLIAAWAGRHWLWGRSKWQWLRQDAGKTPQQMREALGLPVRKKKGPPDVTDAANLGIALREAGLEILERDGDALARGRRKGLQLLRMLPFLCLVVCLFAALSHRFSAGWAISGGVACIGGLVLMRLSGMSVEMKGVTRGVEELRRVRFFNRMSDEDAVIAAARSSIWLSVWPW